MLLEALQTPKSLAVLFQEGFWKRNLWYLLMMAYLTVRPYGSFVGLDWIGLSQLCAGICVGAMLMAQRLASCLSLTRCHRGEAQEGRRGRTSVDLLFINFIYKIKDSFFFRFSAFGVKSVILAQCDKTFHSYKLVPLWFCSFPFKKLWLNRHHIKFTILAVFKHTVLWH